MDVEDMRNNSGEKTFDRNEIKDLDKEKLIH
jgi:hypothetical protein